ncbi:helicase-associated domain-containing protein [Gemmata sp. G18]|uniref:Helicase-associated domain-containing protein n=1 Tax=Gemmata palustris TaxID=2822762 RepID=A0ABS5C279_9BACT|nr:helicase-associated domain-containing protein [Gemmata palustris]MBP3960082.1 helicase-associated domain-containing protein [Gemmata palustris]
MTRAGQNHEARTAEQEFNRLTIDGLRPLVALLTPNPPKKKGELVAVLTRAVTDPARVRALYDQLDRITQLAVREATHDPNGHYSRTRFVAKYGREVAWYEPTAERKSSWYDPRRDPTHAVLFFPNYDYLPADVRAILLKFVPAPDPFQMRTCAEPPTERTLLWPRWSEKSSNETVPIRVRETAREAEADLPAVLRLIDAGKVRVTDKKHVPTEATRKAITGVLAGGDFYTPGDADKHDGDPAHDLTIKAFAWPMLVQTAGLAEKRGDALKLTPAGRSALNKPAAELLDGVWAAWQKTHLIDEFARIDVIKGQGRADFTAVATRRKAVLNVLKDCPPGEWVAVEDFWRLMRGTGRGFTLVGERDSWELYLFEQEYGSLGYEDAHAWEQLQGRFILAFLFEIAATIGVLDVAYIPPQGARNDFRERWGVDDLSCFSRYDGLLYFRINPLGAWCLGLVEEYQPAAPQKTDALRVLANLDVVATRPPAAADRLVLERFAEETSPAVWKLSAAKILGVVEQGGRVEELRGFLSERSVGGVPAAVETFLSDLHHKAGQLKDGGPARLIECATEHVAAELANDRQLKGKCVLAGDRLIVVREVDLPAVRKSIRKLGFVWPLAGE